MAKVHVSHKVKPGSFKIVPRCSACKRVTVLKPCPKATKRLQRSDEIVDIKGEDW